jgi:hypothetical protein
VTLADRLTRMRLPARSRELLGMDAVVGTAFEQQVTRRLAGELARLVGALCGPGEELLAVDRLVGLGPGATPSGDDILVGVMAAGAAFLPEERSHRLRAALAAVPDSATTRTGAFMLHCAAEGDFCQPLQEVLQAKSDFEDAVARLSRLGAHSGSDMLAGVMAVVRRAAHQIQEKSA